MTALPKLDLPETLIDRSAALAREFAKGAAARDLQAALPHDEMKLLAASGILGARIPLEFGGPELPYCDIVRIFVNLAAGDPNIAQSIQPHTCLVEKLRFSGTAEQRARYYPEIAQGVMVSNAVAEREGKFIGDTATLLRPAPGGWRLSGDKYYCTGSAFAQLLWISALAPDGRRAIAIVPATRQGVSVLDDWSGMGQRTSASGSVILQDVAVADDELLFLPPPGAARTPEGALGMLLHAAIDVGIAQAALRDGVAYGTTAARPMRESRVERASDDPYVLERVGRLAVKLRAAELLADHAALRLDRSLEAYYAGRQADDLFIESSIAVAEAKIAAAEAALRVSEGIYDLGGASATLRERNLDRHWRNARTHINHDYISYKIKAVGDFYLNGNPPPISTKI